ncbi:MAG: protein phosphatase 2C domain-containing protein [Bacteroidaceae bacterium]|nr:protein phosphatase 2C domain-containing protein [Bacteroidaceae bacterium]
MRYVHNQTVKGASHADAGKECQDASLSWTDDELAIIVVSDGHSGEKHNNSAIGAALACQITQNHLREFSLNVDDEWLSHKPEDIVKQLSASILAEWTREIAELEEGADVMSYGCTLIAYVQTRHFWLALQIGDGRCVMHNKADVWIQPIPWDDRCFLNMTTSLCDENAANEFRFAYGDVESIPKAVFLCSDGIDGTFGSGELLYGFYGNIIKSINDDGIENVVSQLPEVLSHYSRTVSKDDMSIAFVLNDT